MGDEAISGNMKKAYSFLLPQLVYACSDSIFDLMIGNRTLVLPMAGGSSIALDLL